jgi:YidC/Oxa1 family membrane protein insertase
MGVMFYKVAAGLCIYFIVSSLWGLCERKLLPKRKPITALAAATASPGNGSTSSGGGKPGRGKGKPDKKEKKPEGAFQKMKDMWAELLRQAEKK